MDEITKTVRNFKEALESNDLYIPDEDLKTLVEDNYETSDISEWTYADFTRFADDVCAEGYQETLRQWGLE